MINALRQLWKTEKNKVTFKCCSMTNFDTKGYLNMELLRFTTAGSVDDGKSTLIGRLLYDCKSIFEDQLETLKKANELRGKNGIDLALLTDGLRAEREQGITIDVAYRYFATPKRKFIIADTPGHIEYTRNMVTGASTANLAIVLIDARKGIVEQTCRHSFIASLLQIKHLIVCINKMDLVDYDESVFSEIRKEFQSFSSKLNVSDIQFVPISALYGDNVVDRSEKMTWYDGPTLLYLLENIHISADQNHIDCRFPVQYVIRPQTEEYHDYRGYAGRIAGGVFKPGDEVVVLPSGFKSKIKTIDVMGGQLKEAFAPQSVTMTLEDDLDVSRGDIILKEGNMPETTQDIDVMVCWLNKKPLLNKGKYTIQHTTKKARCLVNQVYYKVDINTLHRMDEDLQVNMNDIAKVRLRITEPLFVDRYQRNRNTGSLILVDEASNVTVGACMII